MKLCKLKAQEKIWNHIEGLSIRLRKEGISLEENISPAPKQSPKRLIIIGNGTPDDLVTALFASKFNGKKLAWLTKPEGLTRTAVFSIIPTYLMGEELGEILILIDQEEASENEIVTEAKVKLREKEIEILKEEGGKKIRIFTYNYKGKEFKLIILINGLKEPYTKHAIEDYLLEAAKHFSAEKIEEVLKQFGYNPKDTWQKGIEKEKQSKIFEELFKAEKEQLREFFPQHMEAFQLLK